MQVQKGDGILGFHYVLLIYMNLSQTSWNEITKTHITPNKKFLFFPAIYIDPGFCYTADYVAPFRRFRKIRKVTINFVMSVRPSVLPSVRMEQLGCHWTDFDEIWYLWRFQVLLKIQVSATPDKSTSHEDRCTFMIISRWILLRTRNVPDKVVERSKCTFYVQWLFPKIVPFEIMWKNMVQPNKSRLI